MQQEFQAQVTGRTKDVQVVQFFEESRLLSRVRASNKLGVFGHSSRDTTIIEHVRWSNKSSTT
jgi:hypothetical protein